MADPDNDTPVLPPEGEIPENADAQAPEAAVAATEEPEAIDEAKAADTQAPEAESAPTAAAQATPAGDGGEPAEQLSPKERRRKARIARSAAVGRSARSPEERHAERVATRRDKAGRRRTRRLQERAKAAERRAASPAPEPLAPVHAAVEGSRRERQGIVVSDKAEKTIVVRIDTARRHRRYEKIVRSSSTLHAHDENNDAHEGDIVRVVESRPLSRTKRWRLVDVLERAR
jgi:small subunit ribosomal protein S17